MCFYFLDNRFTSEFPDCDVVEFPIPSVPNQRLVLAVLFDDRGNQLESEIGFRLRPAKRTEQVIGNDDLIEIGWNGCSRGWNCRFCRQMPADKDEQRRCDDWVVHLQSEVEIG